LLTAFGRGEKVLKPVKLWEAGLKDLMHRCCVLALKTAISSSVKPSARTQDRFSVRLQDRCDGIQTDSAQKGCTGDLHGHADPEPLQRSCMYQSRACYLHKLQVVSGQTACSCIQC